MSMAKVNRAFAEAMKGKAGVEGCVMVWERGDDGKQRQRLTCFVTLANGTQQALTGLFDGRADLVVAAVQMAADFSGDKAIPAPVREVWDMQKDAGAPR